MKQIDIFDTIFQFAEQYDPDIKNIKMYGILDENNHCSEPYFMFNDVINYIKGNIGNNSTRKRRMGFKNTREIIQMKVSQNKRDSPNLLTRYGMIRTVGLCKKIPKPQLHFANSSIVYLTHLTLGTHTETPYIPSFTHPWNPQTFKTNSNTSTLTKRVASYISLKILPIITLKLVEPATILKNAYQSYKSATTAN